MNELKKDVDVLSKKRPTVNELKTEVIRLRKSNEKSDAGLNHYKVMYENICNEDKALCSMSSKLSAANNQLEANNKTLKDGIKFLESKLDKANKDYEELKAKRQYNTVGFCYCFSYCFRSCCSYYFTFSIMPIRTLFN